MLVGGVIWDCNIRFSALEEQPQKKIKRCLRGHDILIWLIAVQRKNKLVLVCHGCCVRLLVALNLLRGDHCNDRCSIVAEIRNDDSLILLHSLCFTGIMSLVYIICCPVFPFKFLPLILLSKNWFLDGPLRHIPSYACVQVSRLRARPVGTEPWQATPCSS